MRLTISAFFRSVEVIDYYLREDLTPSTDDLFEQESFLDSSKI
jgi:hypothetical protein